MGLEDYKDIIGTTASICTMAQMFSGTIICRDIYRKGTSQGFDPVPFVGGIGIGMLMFQYALIVGDPAMISVNIFGLLTSFAYVAFFYAYSPTKSNVIKLLGKVVAISGLLLSYAQFEDPSKLEFRWGMLVTGLLFLLIGAPLFNIREIIRTKSTDILPFPMILVGTFVSLQWMLYGYIIGNGFMIFQNVFGFVLQLIQLSLFIIFPSQGGLKPESKEE